MEIQNCIQKTPWDRALGLEAYEIKVISKEVLDSIAKVPGHYTAKVDPLASKKLLHDYGFYYCDSLIEPFCARDKFIFLENDEIEIAANIELSKLLPLCHGAFSHGRFHRDFNISQEFADLRYDNWFKDLHGKGNIRTLIYQDNIAGFIAFVGNKLVLHAMAENYRGKGLAKFFWSAVCAELFKQGYAELFSSVSAANVAAINLYAALGFKFRNCFDVYHLLIT